MRRSLLLAIFPLLLTAGVVDRIAVVVGKTVITESEILDNLRVTEFLNGEPLDFSPVKRREAAEHLVDQQLLRNEMEAGSFAMPAAGESDALLQKFIQQHYRSVDEYRAALEKYGIPEAQLKQELTWQLAVMRFTDFRFPADLSAPSDSADRQTPTAASSVDQQLEAWLKDARSNTRVIFTPEAFQ